MFDLRSIGLAGLLCVSAATVYAQGTPPNFSSADHPWVVVSQGMEAPPIGLGPIQRDTTGPQITRRALGGNANGGAPDGTRVVREQAVPMADVKNPNLKPWVAEKLKQANEERAAGNEGWSARASCMPPGVPGFVTYAGMFKPVYFAQSKDMIVMMNQGDNQVRTIHLNVPHLKNPKPSWYGNSVGHYEGGELVIDTIGLNDKTLVQQNFDVPHSTQLHVVERFKLTDDGKGMTMTVTIDDPGAFNAPWTGILRFKQLAQPTVLYEEPCAEGNMVAETALGHSMGTPVASKADF